MVKHVFKRLARYFAWGADDSPTETIEEGERRRVDALYAMRARNETVRTAMSGPAGRIFEQWWLDELFAMEREEVWRVTSWDKFLVLKGRHEGLKNLCLLIDQSADSVDRLTEEIANQQPE